jgi:hypothetical protein
MDQDQQVSPALTTATTAPSVITPTLPPDLQRLQTELQLAGPAPGNQNNPLLAPLPPATSDPPAVPQLDLHQDSIVGQDHQVDPNDKGFGISGTWDTAGPKSAPRVTGAYADVPVNSPQIHGNPAQVDLPSK